MLDGVGNGAVIRYDFGGRRTLVETTGGATQQFEYDPMGNIVGTVDGVGNRTGYILDKWGRVTECFRGIKVSECPVEELIIKIKRKGLFLWENK